MNSDGNRIQNGCTPRHWEHLMHGQVPGQVPPMSGTTSTI